MKTKAFTIIEVLVAVIILSTVATLLFSISMQSKSNYSFYKKKLLFENTASVALFRDKLSNTNLYEQVRSEYNIKDDELRRVLKKIKIQKKTKEISFVKLDKELGFKIYQEQIFSKNSSSNYFKIGIK